MPLHKPKAGEPITAEFLNEIVERLERGANLSVAPGGHLRMFDGPEGKHLVLAPRRPIKALLSGSSSPYSWTEVQAGPGGTWVPLGGRTGTSNAYELNGVSGLGGKVAELTWTAAGDWRFNHVRTGVPLHTFLVRGCDEAGIAGAVITVSSYTCTTGDGTGGTILGQCTLRIPSGTYPLTVTPPSGSGFATYTAPVTFGGVGTTVVSLSPDTEHVCSCVGNYPVPKTLIFSDGFGSHTLTWIGGTQWTATYSDSTDIVVNGGFGPACVASGTMTITYVLTCFSSVYSFAVNWNFTCCGFELHGSAWYSADGNTSGSVATSVSTSCSFSENPFLLTATVPTSTADSCPLNRPGGNGLNTPGGGGAISISP